MDAECIVVRVNTDRRIILIAAVAANGVIGREGDLPWHLPDDMRRFMTRTRHHPVVMGRRTWESLKAPLRGRTNIVLSGALPPDTPGAVVARTIEDAIAHAREAPGGDTVFIIGGEAVYRVALPMADELDLTEIDGAFEGDVRFPEWPRAEWTMVEEERHPADATHVHSFTFRRYVRSRDPGSG